MKEVSSRVLNSGKGLFEVTWTTFLHIDWGFSTPETAGPVETPFWRFLTYIMF